MNTEEREVKRVKLDSAETANAGGSVSALGIVETDVGITEYLSDGLGFKGTLKQRYTDFLVNEVDRDGSVLHLTDLGLADKRDIRRERRELEREGQQEEDKGESTEDQAKQDESNEKKRSIPEPSAEQRQKLIELLGGEDVLQKVMELFHTGSKYETPKSYESKDERTALHQLVRESFQSRLETSTTPENKFLITLSTNPLKGRRTRTKLDKSGVGPAQEYLHFTLYKENKETMEVANLLSKFLRIPPKSVSYAGTKDRRGVTVQRACVSKVSVERLNGMNKTLRGIKLGSFKYQTSPLKLGDLQGNEFFITIRDVTTAAGQNIKDVVDQAFSALRDQGFINYYGMQRFGTFSISTHTIGRYVLNYDWEKVVELILSPQELVLPDSVEARKVWAETHDAAKALALMPRKCVAEYALLRSLSREPKAYLNAVMQIPRNLRVMYGHAYQSYVWNAVASERVKQYGLKIVPGDLVIDDDSQTANGTPSEVEPEEDLKEQTFVRARPVRQEEIDNGTKTIYDVVLPSPGFDVVYPSNDLKQIYSKVMGEHGLNHLDMHRNIKEFSLAGSYRHVISRPSKVEWWVKNYSGPVDQLVRTDLELLQEGLSESDRLIEVEDGERVGVVLKLQLGTSQYATMALREVMKVDTSRRGEGLNVQSQSKEKKDNDTSS